MSQAIPSGVLRELRELAGFSLRDLERSTGINRGRLSVIERGATARADEVTAIAAALVAAIKDGLDRGTIQPESVK